MYKRQSLDFAHPARADGGEDLEWAEAGAGGEGHDSCRGLYGRNGSRDGSLHTDAAASSQRQCGQAPFDGPRLSPSTGGLFRRCQGTWDKHLFLGEIHKLGAEFVDTPPSWGADYEDRLVLSLEQDGV